MKVLFVYECSDCNSTVWKCEKKEGYDWGYIHVHRKSPYLCAPFWCGIINNAIGGWFMRFIVKNNFKKIIKLFKRLLITKKFI